MIKLHVIHRPAARERKKDLVKNLKGWDYELIAPELPHDGQWSLTRTHVALIKRAQAENLPYIIVCEDDLLPSENFRPDFMAGKIAEAEAHSADVLLLGVCFARGCSKIDNGMYRAGKFDGTQMVVYFNRMYHRAGDMLESYGMDGTKHNVWISTVIMAMGFKTLISFPFMAYQKQYKDSMCQSGISYQFREASFLKLYNT